MKSNPYFYHWYYYTQAQKRGFILVIFGVVLIQIILCFVVYYQLQAQAPDVIPTKIQVALQAQLDSLRNVTSKKKDTIYPFNPNYISDYKGYFLELSTVEIDRLLAFRANKQMINSTQDFQKVTGVSNEWMQKYNPYFVFDTRSRAQATTQHTQGTTDRGVKKHLVDKQLLPLQDINQATAESLQLIRGIGPALSKRIIEDRNKWGGYVHLDQLKFVYGLSEEVIDALFQQFAVLSTPTIDPLDLNEAGVNELKNIPYLNYYLAREIVKYRSLNGDFVNKRQLREIEKIPLDRIHIISLYLKIRN